MDSTRVSDVITKVGSHRTTLENLLARNRGVVRVASPYVTDKGLLAGSNPPKVRLLVALSEWDIVAGATSLNCLQQLIESGVKCRVLKAWCKLHAKVYIFGEDCAIVTSANLTTNALDRNIEAGVLLRGPAVSQLTNWFEDYWNSEAAQPLTEGMIVDLRDRTAVLKKKFKHLRSLLRRKAISSTGQDCPSINIPPTAQYFICNTDRRHGYEAEKLMRESNFAAAWEDFDYIGHVETVKRGDLVFMYANRAGIIAVGEAKGEHQTLPPATPHRIIAGDSAEWRIPVNWLRWADAEHACPWARPPYKTFVDVSSDHYAAQRKRVLKHFNIVL